MNWSELLEKKMTAAYHATEGLLALVDDRALGWKPATGSNWMTTGQLLRHMTTACGFCCRAFLTGEWGMPDNAPPEDMLPSAERMPSSASVAEARKGLASDREMAFAALREAGEERLSRERTAAPWNPEPRLYGEQLLVSVEHLESHKAQLFYYLKLQGKPVHTGNLWGM